VTVNANATKKITFLAVYQGRCTEGCVMFVSAKTVNTKNGVGTIPRIGREDE
jgi:hypothetical protein